MSDGGTVDTIIPWTIKAISKAARDTATDAARRDGLTVGQWLEKAINGYLDAGSPTAVAVHPSMLSQASSRPVDRDPAIAELAALLTAVGTLPEHIPLPGEVRTLVNQLARSARGGAPAAKASKKAIGLALEGKAEPD